MSSPVLKCAKTEMELTHLMAKASSTDFPWRCIDKGGTSERDLRAERSRLLDPGDCPGAVSRNTVRKYLKSEAMRPKPRKRRASQLDPYTEYVDGRLSEGLENCVLHRELSALGFRLFDTESLCVAAATADPEATMR